MHELGIAQEILDTALENGRKAGARKITSVHVKLGEHAAFEEDGIRFCFDALKRNTIAAEAELAVEKAPLTATCPTCNTSFSAEQREVACPACGSLEVNVSSGHELYVDSVEFV